MGSPVFAFFATTIVGVAMVASIVYHFQRETTSIEDKYTNRSSAEIDATYHQSYLNENLIVPDDTYSDNVVNSDEVSGPAIATYAGSNSNDYDNDGLNNAVDPDPYNPDTDGDGLIDSQDPKPTDPARGQTATPPPANPPEQAPQAGELVINELYTNVRNRSRGGTGWVSHTDAKPSDQLGFIVHFVLQNTSDYAEYKATLHDYLDSTHLKYIAGSTSVFINDVEVISGQSNSSWMPGPGQGNDWRDSFNFTVQAGQTITVDIMFSATAKLDQPNSVEVASNFVRLVTPQHQKTDVAFVTINSYPLINQ